jgi:hypothetical protein
MAAIYQFDSEIKKWITRFESRMEFSKYLINENGELEKLFPRKPSNRSRSIELD